MAAVWLFVLSHNLSELEAVVQLVMTALFEETKYVFRETNQRMTAGYTILRTWPLTLQIPGKMSSKKTQVYLTGRETMEEDNRHFLLFAIDKPLVSVKEKEH